MRSFLAISMLWVFASCVCESIAQPKTHAPGVLKVVPASIDVRDSFSLPMTLEGLDAAQYSPHFAPVLDTLHGQSQNVVFFRDVWQYEFAFLGLRQAKLPLTTANGSLNKNVWYMVYRIRNTGVNISYDQIQEDQRFEHIKNDLKRNSDDFEIESKLVLHFYLNGWVEDEDGQFKEVRYRDQVDPEALRLIRQIEDNNRYLADKVEMMFARFPVSKSAEDGGLWGVAIWQDIDPRIDYVNIQVRGLTNAFRISTSNEGEREFKHRNLQLNFWRPGDTFAQDLDRVTYGIPLVDDPVRQVEICKRYQLPGPLIRGYLESPSADQNVLVAELDANIQFDDFKSTITPTLDNGTIPGEVAAAFKNAGFAIPEGTPAKTLVKEKRWSFSFPVNGEPREFTLVVEPQYWEPETNGIRFIKSLDNLWIYR